MGRKRRPAAASAPDTPVTSAAAAPAPPAGSDARPAVLLALMALLAPALGVPSELMLQDTLKSIIVAGCTLVAALLFFLRHRLRREPLRWHTVLWLPLLLLAYALGSMAWSHAYLGGVEAVRWFLFALIAWLALNTFERARLPWLAWGVHLGAAVASLWAVLQFLAGFDFFPQGPNPASTFVNRNFFAEYVVCTLPFSFLLLARARQAPALVALGASNALVVVAIMMTGTRAALIALWLQLLLVLPLIAWRCRGQLAWSAWKPGSRAMAALAFVGTVLLLGVLPSSNPKILEEGRGATAFERALNRTQSIGPRDESLGIRMEMWGATLNMIQARPVTGVGAGAWESEVPLYQAQGAQLETDYYVHNEYLQLLGEYGLAGWIFLVLLLGYLGVAGWRTWRAADPPEREEQPWRAVLLCSLLALLVVSNIGFPWRMAATGALFALCIGALAASDARLSQAAAAYVRSLRWGPVAGTAGVAASAVCLALGLYIAQRAAEAERKLVSAVEMALSISGSGAPNDPRFDGEKQRMLQLLREGIAANPHYRKITPMVADEIGRWGDWANAVWIWESVLRSRPHIVAMTTNVARGYSMLDQPQQAMAYLKQAQALKPDAPAVRSLEVILLAKAGDEAQAMRLARQALAAGIVDYDLVNVTYILATRSADHALAERMLRMRMQGWPETRARSLVQLGALYANELRQPEQGLQFIRQGFAESAPAERDALLRITPPALRGQLEAPAPQTSANSK